MRWRTLILIALLVSRPAPADLRGFVLTGGPGSGKSALAIALEINGESVAHEAAVDIIRFELARGNPNPWSLPDFQRNITALQTRRQVDVASRAKNGRFFVDRSTVDSLAYQLVHTGVLAPDLTKMILKSGLETLDRNVCFIVGRDSIETNEHRRENLGECARIEDALRFVYDRLGFDLTPIAFADLAKRLDDVLRVADQSSPVDPAFGERVVSRLRDPEWRLQLCRDWLAR